MKLFIVWSALLLHTVLTVFTITFQAQSLSSYFTLIDSVNYQLNFTLPNPSITSGSTVKIPFSNKYNINSSSLQNCQASTSSSVAPTAASCSVAYQSGSQLYEVTMSGIFPSTTTYSFLLLLFTISNPYAEKTQTITVSIYNPSDNLQGYGSAFLTYTASSMSSCSIETSTQVTGENSTHTLYFTPSQRVIADSQLQVTMPLWYSTNSTSNQGADPLVCTGLQNTDSSSLTCDIQNVDPQETLTIQNIISSNKTVNEVQIQIQSLRNPWSFEPFGAITFDLMVDGELSQSCTDIYTTVTEHNTLKTILFSIPTLTISTTNQNIRMIFVVRNPFPKPDNRVKISHPDSISLTFTGSTTIYSQSTTEIIFSGVNSISIGNFTVVTPPSTRAFTLSFTTQKVTSGVGYDIDQSELTYQNAAGALSSISVVPDSSFINEQTKYTITFTVQHALTSGSFIEITFPTDLSIELASSCSYTGHTCNINDANNITVSIQSSISASTVVTVVVNDVNNANQASETDTFTIQTYYDSLYDSLVDQTNTGITVTMTARQLTNSTVTPSSLVTYQLTSYLFSFTLSDPIPAGGYFQIIFPSTVDPQTPTLISASFSTGTCSITEPTSKTVRITGCFASQLNKLEVTITIGNIRNPPSFLPSASFEVNTYGPSSVINFLDSGLTVTMDTASAVQAFSVVPTSNVVHDTTTYTFTIDHKITIHAANDYALILFPSSVSVPDSPSCTATSGTVTCTKLRQNELKAEYTTTPNDVVEFNLDSVLNFDLADFDVTFEVSVYDSADYLMESYDQLNITFTEAQLSSVTVNNDDNIALGEPSNITLTITNDFTISSSLSASLTTLHILIPEDFTIGTQCTSTSGTCSPLNSSAYEVTSVGRTLTNLNVTMKDVTLNYFDPTSQTFKVIYFYDDQPISNISVLETGIVVRPFCDSPCQRCDTTATDCQSCLPAPNTLIYYDPDALSCQSSCVSGKYPDDTNECQLCVSPCSACLDEVNCTSCVTNTWLYEQGCLSICPDTYYNDSSGVCLECISPCGLCTSLTSCESCVTGYLTNNQCVNAEDCPAGTFANTTTLECESCTFPCFQCSLSPANCTSCENNYLFISASNQCVQNCPDGMYPKNDTYCFNCVSPCDTCSDLSQCTSCLTGYLTSGDCVDAGDCPDGTYANDATKKCSSCPSGCTLCDNVTTCTQCSSVYFFYEFQCLTTCPSGTFKENSICQACTSPCATCITTAINCLSCQSPKLFYENQCLNTCPDDTYEDSGVCELCMSTCETCSSGTTCDSCSGSRYLNVDECVTSCPSGTYSETSNNECVACTSPCSTCSISSTNCTKCVSPFVEFQNRCDSTTCPDSYFDVDGSCVTCPNCINCLDSDTCLECDPSYYEYNGICYINCPTQAPIPDEATNTCGGCDSSCRSCEGTAKNCTSCYSGTYLFQGTCLSDCPTGFIEDVAEGTCIEPLIGSVIYFPFSFAFVFFLIVTIASKCKFPPTQHITVLAAFTSLCEFGSWALLTFILLVDYTLQQTLIDAGFYLGISILALSIVTGIVWTIVFYHQYDCDRGFQIWKEHDEVCVRTYRVINVFSGLSFRFFRLLYSRFFDRFYFSAYISYGERLLTHTNRLTFVTIFLMTLPMMGISATFLYFKKNYDQTFFSSIDTLILGFASMVFLTIDSAKDKDYFDDVKNGLPFLKYRNLQGGDQSFAGESLLSKQEEGERQKMKTEIGNREKDEIFRKIQFIPNINKFGHLNVIQNQDDKDEIKSLPEYNKLQDLPQYDPNNRSEHDRVIDDLFFLEEEKKRREQEEREEMQRQRERQRKKKQQEERRRKQEEERRRRLMLEDQEERVNLEFPDIAAIEKVENKDKKNNRRSPLQLLSNCKKVDQKPINEKAMKKLEDTSKKNGLDAEYMKETFGVEKNHNQEMLNQIIDKHYHVKRESVKELFNEKNDEEVLQELFGKNSNMDPEKLREVLNDPDSVILIQNLASKENGKLSPEMAKQLLDKNSNYTKQFTKELLKNENGMDEQKLKTVLKQSNGKGKQSPLKALKKVGGENLENKEVLNNMLGENAVLNPDSFTKVANDLSITALKNIFENKTKESDVITSKILNNKKIKLKNIVPILEDQELVQDLAHVLGQGNQNIQNNIVNLFKNADEIDPQKLKEMLKDPVLKDKLLSNPVDPIFLQEVLKKDGNKDLNLLKETINQMSEEEIQQTFKFDPEKNIDFKNVAQIFDKNEKTDPKLVSKLLNPDMVKELYVKGNDTKMLNKLVEKGNQFDPDVIKGVYGKQRNHFFETHTENLINLEEEKKNDFHSQKQYSLGFQKNPKNEVNMSRTAGMLNFLRPIVPKVNKNKMKEDFEKEEQENIQWQSDGDGSEIIDDLEIDDDLKKKKKKGKKVKKKVVDFRHPSQEIYLQRIQAAHEHATKKASIRKKKTKASQKEIMTLENDVFDMNF